MALQNNEPYWFQDIGFTILNLNFLLKIFPTNSMSYPEKINSLVRLSIYIGLILALFYSNYLFLYIPVITMILTYVLYLFRMDNLNDTIKQYGPNAKITDVSRNQLNNLTKKYMNGETESFDKVLGVKKCSAPSQNNPFMNPLVFDSRNRNMACDPVANEVQFDVESEYNKYCIKDASDIFNHNSGRRQFYTVASTTYPNNQGAFANWLYGRPPTCKEGNGAQCIANYYTPLNRSLLTPGVGSTP